MAAAALGAPISELQWALSNACAQRKLVTGSCLSLPSLSDEGCSSSVTRSPIALGDLILTETAKGAKGALVIDPVDPLSPEWVEPISLSRPLRYIQVA